MKVQLHGGPCDGQEVDRKHFAFGGDGCVEILMSEKLLRTRVEHRRLGPVESTTSKMDEGEELKVRERWDVEVAIYWLDTANCESARFVRMETKIEDRVS